MKLATVIEELQLKQIGTATPAREVDGVYCSDLLSDVMANGGPGDLLVTILTHENVIAVASLMELSAVLITGGKTPGEETVCKAEENGVPLLVTDLSTFETAGKLYQLLNGRHRINE